MLYIKIKNFLWDNKYTIGLFLSLFLYTTEVCAATQGEGTFGALRNAGATIFKGLRKVIYPAATIGVACVCIGGMFGNFNWKWLIAILLGIFIISYAAGVGSLAGADVSADLNGQD